MTLDAGAIPISPEALSRLVPARYALVRPVVVEGLTRFLRRLSFPRLMEIAAAQAKLPQNADLPTRLVHLMHASPALHKLGQVLARRRELAPSLRRRLQRLESMEPRTGMEEIGPVIARALGDRMQRFDVRLGRTPLAEASVAMVVPITWRRRGASPRRDGVIKILRPGVERRLDEDLDILAELADHVEDQAAALGLPRAAYHEVFHEARTLLLNEIRLDHEQAHLRRAAEQYASDGDVQIPGLLPFCTDQLTAMERVYGRKVPDIPATSQDERRRLFNAIIRSMLSDVIFSRDQTVLFHGDPHAGNLFAGRDGRLAILDWSLAGRLTHVDRVCMGQILLHAMVRHRDGIMAAIQALATNHPALDAVQPIVERDLARLGLWNGPGLDWVMHLLDDMALSGKVRFSPHLMLFRKSFFTLEGVLSNLWPAGSIQQRLFGEAITRAMLEWPLRYLKPIWSRDYDVPLSTADVMLALGRGFLSTLNRPPFGDQGVVGSVGASVRFLGMFSSSSLR